MTRLTMQQLFHVGDDNSGCFLQQIEVMMIVMAMMVMVMMVMVMVVTIVMMMVTMMLLVSKKELLPATK